MNHEKNVRKPCTFDIQRYQTTTYGVALVSVVDLATSASNARKVDDQNIQMANAFQISTELMEGNDKRQGQTGHT